MLYNNVKELQHWDILNFDKTFCQVLFKLISEHTWNISNPAMSSIPMNEAPCFLDLSRDLLILPTNHLNILSYKLLLIASTANSTCGRKHLLQLL